MARLRFDFTLPAHRKRFALLALLLGAALVLTVTLEWILSASLRTNWDSVRTEEQQFLVTYVQTSFQEFQQEVVSVVRQVRNDTAITNPLLQGSGSNRQIFERLQALNLQDNTIEVFDRSKTIRGWSGSEGIRTDTNWLQRDETSFVLQGPIYSYLIVTAPVQSGNLLSGFIVVKRLFDVEYPISNRFINESVFSASFTTRYEINADFDFSHHQSSETPAELLRAPLTDIHGNTLGFALLHPPALEEREETLHTRFQTVKNALILLSLLFVMVGIGSISFLKRSRWRNIIWIIVCLWGFRYALIATDIFPSLFHLDIFDPALFASTFGFGIAKSIGDLLITALTLLASILLVTAELYRASQPEQMEGQVTPRGRVFLSLAITSLVFPLLLRGYAAIIRSAVYDSTMSYFDSMYILPSHQLGMMLLALFLISIALSLLTIAGIIYYQRALGRTLVSGWRAGTLFLFVLIVLITGSLVVGLLHPNPLFNQFERIGYIFGFGLCSYFLSAFITTSGKLYSIRTLAIIVFGSLAALLYPLEKKVHDFDRSHVEFLASTVFQSADAYLTTFTQQALKELSASEYNSDLNGSEPGVARNIAFKTWAQSILSREGYNCSVTYLNRIGNPVSTFTIGTSWAPDTLLKDSIRVPRSVVAEDRAIESRIIRFYRGYEPIFDSLGAFAGGVNLEVTAEKQALIGGETPEFLRNLPTGEVEGRHRTVTYSEYLNGELLYSSSATFHRGIVLPQTLPAAPPKDGFWIDQPVDTAMFETFLFPADEPNSASTIRALSMRKLDPIWHLYHVLRIAFYLLLCSLAVAFLYYVSLLIRKQSTGFSFRAKLVGSFVVVALIPTGILAYYNRQYATDRLQQTLVDQLNRETTTLVTALTNQWRINTPFDLSGFTDQDAALAAGDFNIPFTLFNQQEEQASSKPELFRAELFDRRILPDVYLNIFLRHKPFYAAVQSIGTLQYVVGYRPLVSEAGTVYGVVAVPTLFRQREIDRELVRQNAYLFGAFVFAMLIALIVALLFSHQITSPIRRLLRATRRIGAGDFSVAVGTTRTDELGELERSFQTMLNDLKQSQDAALKAQRELAWKEMAKQVAHEIKNPLTPMKLSLQHLRQAYSDRAPDFEQLFKQVITTVLEQIETLSRIASEFSHFARMPEKKPEQCDLHLILREVTNLFQQYGNVTFNLQFSPFSAIILADKEELRRAFINIVRNSIQAMNEQGTITIRTKRDENRALISVHDTGSGIAPEMRSHLFEPNFSTKTDGMGLGLALVKKTVDDLGGTISIDSADGQGTTVTFNLPITFAE